MRRCLLLLAALLTPGATPAAESFLDQSMAQWRQGLQSKDPVVRRSSAFALGRLGILASFTVDDLERLLRDDRDPAVREMAARAIGDIVLTMRHFAPKREWDVVGKTLQAHLADEVPLRVRRAAAYALGCFGSLAAPAVPALRQALRDPSASVRQNAAWSLGRILTSPDRPTVEALCALLTEPSPLVRRDAAGALGQLGTRLEREPLRPAAAALIRRLGDERDSVVLRTALGALTSLADESHRGQAGALYPLLASKETETARLAAYVLANVGGEPARRAIPLLRQALADTDSTVQAVAAACLANAGAEAAPAATDLARLLGAGGPAEVRRNAAIALGRLAEATSPDDREKPTYPRLVEQILPALEKATRPTAAAPGTERHRAEEEIRGYAVEALARIAYPYNRAALPTIRTLLRKDTNQHVRLACVWCLFGCTRLDDHDLVPVLEGVLAETADDGRWVRYEVARVLAFGQRDKASDRTLATLLAMIRDPGLRVYEGTGTTVAGVADEGQKASSRATNVSGGDARYMAAQAMGWLGSRGRNDARIVTALRQAAKESDPKLREWAGKSLKQLGVDDD